MAIHGRSYPSRVIVHRALGYEVTAQALPEGWRPSPGLFFFPRPRTVAFALLLGILLCTALWLEAVCTLQWDAVTLNDNETPVNSTITYRIYRASTHLGYTWGTPFTTTTATSIACATVAPSPGPWYVAVTAVKDTNGLESLLFSNELSPPAAPGGVGAR